MSPSEFFCCESRSVALAILDKRDVFKSLPCVHFVRGSAAFRSIATLNSENLTNIISS